jgi:drug/metabolite transporter superfamily protein YnfA
MLSNLLLLAAALTSPAPQVTQQAYAKASNTGSQDNFAGAVAISGNTLVVGSTFEDSAAAGVNGDQSSNASANAGAAYVFIRNGVSWSQQAYLKASNPETNDSFGQAVAISGDTIVIGAPREDSASPGVNGNQTDNGAIQSGAVYVFVRSGGTWSQQAYLKASNPDINDSFGQAVAISGDTIVIGASNEQSSATGVNGSQSNNSLSGAGAAYVFVRSGSTWTQQAYLKASNTGPVDQFGISVAISGDTIAVGANGEDSSATGVNGNENQENASASGACYVFVRSGSTWTQQAYVKASNTGVSDQFGDCVSLSGDTLVVGASFETSNATGVNGNQADNSIPFAGAAYVFVRSGSTWSQQAYLKASNTAGDRFGQTLCVSGDAIVVGAHFEDSNATGINGNQGDNSASNAGAAYVFSRSGAAWSQQAYLKASNTGADDSFGIGVAVSGDVVAVGADHEDSVATGVNGNQADNNGTNSGAVYLFDLGNHPGVASYGSGTPGCAGTQTLGANHSPIVGSPDFALTCNNSPLSSLGLGILADAQDLAGSDPFGIGVLIHVDLFTAVEVVTVDFVSDGAGNGLAAVPIPNNPFLIGKTYYAMALWAWSSCSLPPFNLSTSRGLALSLLP